MPELPDVVVYLEALTRHVAGRPVKRINLRSPFVLRSVDPPIDAIVGQTVRGVRRIGKRIVFDFDGELFLVIHLMIAGRLGPKMILASFEFPEGTLFFTASSRSPRASTRSARRSRARTTR